MKKLLVLLLLTALCAVTLASCGGNTDTPSDTTPANEDVTTAEPAETTPAPSTDISLADYNIVRFEDAPKSIVSCSATLYKKMNEKLSTPVEIATDWVKGLKKDDVIENDNLEILIGNTNRRESRQIAEQLVGDSAYVIRKVDNKIVIIGSSEQSTRWAIEKFTELYVDSGKMAVEPDLNIVYAPGAEGSPAYILATEYTAIRDEDGGDFSVSMFTLLREQMLAITGQNIKLATDDVPKTKIPETGYVTAEKELLVGVTNRVESIDAAKTVGAMDYTISITDTKVIICGGTPLSTMRGIERFADALRTGEISSLEAGSYTYTEKFTDLYTYNPLCYDYSCFVPVWKDLFNIPDWMRDFDEKTYAITQNNLRNMSTAHRGEIVYYPENSIEGILSAIYAGCDVIEIDVSITKDHVFVLMHDLKLNRTTDWAQKKGTNGLPTSEYIYDWTYEQLQQLNLKTNAGVMTEYKIPTLYEALMVIKGNCFVQLDQKISHESMPNPRKLNFNDEVYVMANEIGCKSIHLYQAGIATMKKWVLRDKTDTEFSAYIDQATEYLRKGALRKRYWAYGDADVSTLNASYETKTVWEKLRAEGKTMLWTNSPLKYSQYIADNFEPAKK